jgi:hypothetical protein
MRPTVETSPCDSRATAEIHVQLCDVYRGNSRSRDHNWPDSRKFPQVPYLGPLGMKLTFWILQGAVAAEKERKAPLDTHGTLLKAST